MPEKTLRDISWGMQWDIKNIKDLNEDVKKRYESLDAKKLQWQKMFFDTFGLKSVISVDKHDNINIKVYVQSPKDFTDELIDEICTFFNGNLYVANVHDENTVRYMEKEGRIVHLEIGYIILLKNY